MVKSIDKSAPELLEKIRSGDLSISDAKKQIVLSNGAPKVHKNGKISKAEVSRRLEATDLLHGDCRNELKKIPRESIDVILTDPIYPGIDREYGQISEEKWHALMQDVVSECRRVLKPKGSAVFILQPNYEKIGRMRPWLWEFVAWAAKEWNLIQDCWWWSITSLPTGCTYREIGLMRQSVKMLVWLGSPSCYRNQENVLWQLSDSTAAAKWEDRCLEKLPSGHTVRRGRINETAFARGGTTPFNLLPIAGANSAEHRGHPASTPYQLAAWWCRYILPRGGVLLDPFCGSGTMLAAGLDNGASKVIGIDKEKKYLAIAKKRSGKG